MKTFLQRLEPRLARAQAEQIADIVIKKTKAGQIETTAEVSEEVARLLQLVRRSEGFDPALEVREVQEPRDVIEGEFINSAMEELDFDMRTLYEAVNQLTGTTRSLKRVLHSQLEELRAGVCRLADDILGNRIQLDNQFARVITQGFADGRNQSQAGRPAVIDQQTRSLKLEARSQKRYHQRRGVNPSRVEIRQLSGGLTGVASRTFAKDNAIDPDPESFWADVLLAESPIRTPYTFSDGSEQTYDGAIVEAELILGQPEFVTDVKLLPFGDYPIDVIDIRIRQGTSEFQFPGFVDRTPQLDWLEWHGPRIQADAIIFVLNQPNYSRVRLHLPTAFIELASFWEQLLDEESRLVLGDEVLTQFQTQRAEADSRFNSLWEGMRRYGVELKRLDIPKPDPDPRVFSDDEILRREVSAAITTMFNQSEIASLQVDHLRSNDVPPRPGITEVERFEYVFGARELQVNDVNYANEGSYASPKYVADSTILEIRVNPDEEHPTFNIGEGPFRHTSIEYEIELAPGRRAPVLPKGTTSVQDELLVLDQVTRQDTTRFPAASTTVTVRRSGQILATSDYTAVALPSGHLRITITKAAFFRSARYTITYTPTANQDALDVDALFDSVLLDKPELFEGTDETGAIELSTFPYIEYGVVNDTDRFRREAERSARHFWIGGNEQFFLDGVMYGDVNTKLDGPITNTDTTITLTSVLGLQTTGLPAQLKIEDEIIEYTGISVNDLTGVTRGVGGTMAVAHADRTPIVGERSYDPLIVTVGNVKARNITAYRTGRHPAFLATSDNDLQYEFLQVGRRLFFNRPLTNKPIAVRYRWMNQYVQVHALLRSHTVGRVPQTPVLRRFHTEIASTVL